MDFRQFQYVLAVAEEKSISKAARKLFVAQPSLSQYIKKLELRLGTPLFDRSTKPLSLTFAGERYVERANTILHLEEQLQREIEDIANSQIGRLTIGISWYIGSLLLPNILPLFQKRFPGIEINLVEGTSDELEEMAAKNKIDLIILNLPINNEQLVHEPILTEDILVALPPKHRFCKTITDKSIRPTLELQQLADEPFNLLEPSNRLRHILDELFAKAGFKPKIKLESKSIATLHQLTAAGMGLTFIGESVTRFDPLTESPVYFYLKGHNFKRTLVVAHKKGKYLTKAAREFIKIVKQILVPTTH